MEKWWHQAITGTNIDQPPTLTFTGEQYHEMLKVSSLNMSFKINNSKLQQHLTGANELTSSLNNPTYASLFKTEQVISSFHR